MSTVVTCPNCQSEMSQLFGADHAGCFACGAITRDAFTPTKYADLLDEARETFDSTRRHLFVCAEHNQTPDASRLETLVEIYRDLESARRDTTTTRDEYNAIKVALSDIGLVCAQLRARMVA